MWNFLENLTGRDRQTEGEGIATTFEHSWAWPPWLTVLGLFLVAVLVIVIYVRERGRAGRRTRAILAGIRVLLVGIVLFMMYGWTQQQHRTDLPDLVIALDDTESMALEDHYAGAEKIRRRLDGAGYDQPSRFNLARSLLLHKDRGWLDRLAVNYRLKLYRIGPSTRPETGSPDDFREALRGMEPVGDASRLGQGLQDVLDAQRGRPTAAILILTDGVTTEGQTIGDVAEQARRKAIPLYLVGLGSDRPPSDVRLSDLLVDDVVFVDEMVNFEVQLHGNGFSGKPAVVRLLKRGHQESLAETTVVVPADSAPTTVRLAYRPQEEGVFEHVVEVEPLDGEMNRDNNRLARRVTVRDATLRVLFVQAYPSYEFRFLKDLLSRAVRRTGERNAIELTTVLQEADLEHAQQDATAQSVFPVRREDLFAYDVVIFGDVNPGFLTPSVMNHLSAFVVERGGGIIFVAGPEFTPSAFRDSPIAPLFPVDLSTISVPRPDEILDEPITVEPTLDGLATPFMQIGDTPEETLPIWRDLPVLYWTLSTPDLRPAARVLAVRATPHDADGEGVPIILLQFVGAGKVIFHTTDETYRWSRFPGNERAYARYWLQALRYLSRSRLSSDDQQVSIETDRDEYRRGDIVRVRVRFTDERRAPPEDDGVSVIVQRSGGRKKPVRLHRFERKATNGNGNDRPQESHLQSTASGDKPGDLPSPAGSDLGSSVRDGTRRGIFEGSISGLPDGQYRIWLASSGEQANTRHFTIIAPPSEQARLAMDADDLQRAAEISRGKFYSLQQADRLPRDLPRGRRVTIESLPPHPIWNSPFIAAAVVLLLTVEWIIRRKVGMV
ncbi:MAG: hypothetical protein ACC628_25100 [Pirellulaceae bacterium]